MQGLRLGLLPLHMRWVARRPATHPDPVWTWIDVARFWGVAYTVV